LSKEVPPPSRMRKHLKMLLPSYLVPPFNKDEGTHGGDQDPGAILHNSLWTKTVSLEDPPPSVLG